MNQEVLDRLKKLQDILADKYTIERELKEIPKSLNTKIEVVNRLKSWAGSFCSALKNTLSSLFVRSDLKQLGGVGRRFLSVSLIQNSPCIQKLSCLRSLRVRRY